MHAPDLAVLVSFMHNCRQLDALAAAVAARIGDFAAALVTAADAELMSLRAAAEQESAAAREPDTSNVGSNGSCAGSHSAQHGRAAPEAGAETAEACTPAMAEAAAVADALADHGTAAGAEDVPVSPFGRFGAAQAGGLSSFSLGPALAEETDASRRDSADDTGILLFGDDNFGSSGLRRRNLSAALTMSPRSRDRSPRRSTSLPALPLQPPAAELPQEQGPSTFVSVDSSSRRNSRSSGESRLGGAAALQVLSEASHLQPLLQPLVQAGAQFGESAGQAAQDLSSSRRLSLQGFLQAQLELLRSQQAWQVPQPAVQQPLEQRAAGSQAPAATSVQASAASSLPMAVGAAAAEVAAGAPESAATALREGVAATAAAADVLPPAGILQAGAVMGAALAVTAAPVAPVAIEAVTTAVSSAASAVASSAMQAPAGVTACAMGDAAASEFAAAAAGPVAEGAAAATCAVSETAADAAGMPMAQTAADVACCAAETPADAALPAANAPAVALVVAARAAAAALAGLTIRQQPSGEGSDHAAAAGCAGDEAQLAAQHTEEQPESLHSAASAEEGQSQGDSLPLAALRGGARSICNGQAPVLTAAAADGSGGSGGLSCAPGRSPKLGCHTPSGGKGAHGMDETCCRAAGTCCCECWQALSAPWLAIRGSALFGWQSSHHLQVNSFAC